MVKKALIIWLLCCFLTSTLSVQSMAYNTPACRLPDEQHTANKIAAFKQKFFDANILGKEIVAYKLGETERSQQEVGRIKATVLRNLENGLAELDRAEYRPIFELIRSRKDLFCAESVTAALNTPRTVLNPASSSEEKSAAGIGTSTIIGAPLGLPIYALSWVIYWIAKGFEEIFPSFGLFLFAVSVILEYFGLYFIL